MVIWLKSTGVNRLIVPLFHHEARGAEVQDLKVDDPRKIGSYDIVKILGKGGMGVVYLGYKGGTFVAVKVMADKYAKDPMFRARFRQEVKAARKVHGDFTAKILDFSSQDNVLWYACEYIPGPTLDEAVRTARFSGEALASFASSLYQALKAIHATGIVHRDLKPSNIILGPKGVRVIDFGVAHMPDQASLTMTGAVIGTPSYMAPEQVHGGQPAQSWDIFAFGCLLAYAATGRTLFGGSSAAAIMMAVASAQPNLSGVPTTLRPLIEHCLRKEPRERATLYNIYRMLPKAQPAAALSTSWMPPAVSARVVDATRVATRLLAEKASVRAEVRPIPQRKPDPIAPKQKKSRVGPLTYLSSLAVIAALLIGVANLPPDDGQKVKPQPTTSALPEIDVDVPKFTAAKLTGKGNPAVEKVEVKNRTLSVTIKFNGSDAERDKILKGACLKSAISSTRFVNMRPNSREPDDPKNVIEFGGALDTSGDITFFAVCDRKAPVTAGQKLGTNKVTSAGNAFIPESKFMPIIDAYLYKGTLRVVLPDYSNYTDASYKQMCLKTSGGLRKPTGVLKVVNRKRPYRLLTFSSSAGTLYLGCKGKSNISYTGSGAKLP